MPRPVGIRNAVVDAVVAVRAEGSSINARDAAARVERAVADAGAASNSRTDDRPDAAHAKECRIGHKTGRGDAAIPVNVGDSTGDRGDIPTRAKAGIRDA